MSENQPIAVGRYLLHRKIARGGMATIHIARQMGDVGFSRIVAAKRMHPELVEDHEFVAMFLDEARIASKVRHRNVVQVIDVVTLGEEVVLVQEYIHGAPLSLLLRNTIETKAHVPLPVAASIACQTLAGMHAAHETADEMGEPLHIVHRDVSPQNVLVGNDGTVRLLDFGVAKAALTGHITRKGTFKGKLGYSSPEQIRGEAIRQSDIYSLGVVLWELLVGHRLHKHVQGEAELVASIMAGNFPTVTEALADDKAWIGSYRWSQLEALEPIVRKALDTNPRRRWQTAADMEEAIAAAVPIASASDVAAWLRAIGKDFLENREKLIAEEEASWRRTSSERGPAPVAATEAPHAGVLSSLTRPFQMLRRGPTALIALLVVLFAASVAFLLRDLKSSPVRAAPMPIVGEPAAAAAAPAALLPVAQSPPEATNNIPSASMQLPDERVAADDPPQEPDIKPDIKPDPKPERSTVRATQRPRLVRAAPARAPAPPPKPAPPAVKPPPPPAPKAATTDCSTPFYFEGSKKIFKPGCL